MDYGSMTNAELCAQLSHFEGLMQEYGSTSTTQLTTAKRDEYNTLYGADVSCSRWRSAKAAITAALAMHGWDCPP